MKTLKCTYPKIKGGVNAIIELEDKILANHKFQDLNDARNWTNSYCEGFRKAEGLKDEETKEMLKEMYRDYRKAEESE